MVMKMITNEALTKYNFITKVLMKSDTEELSKDMKIKVMNMRIKLKKVREAFDSDLKEFADGILSDEFKSLQKKPNKSEEEIKAFQEQADKINAEYAAYVQHRGAEEVDITIPSFTEDEYNELLLVNIGNDVEINGQKVSSGDFLEIIHGLFVKE